MRRDHRLTEDEMRNLTLAHVEALEERRSAEQRYARYNAGVVAAAVINCNLDPDAPRISPFDFIPGWLDEEEDDGLDREAIARNLRCFLTAAVRVREQANA